MEKGVTAYDEKTAISRILWVIEECIDFSGKGRKLDSPCAAFDRDGHCKSIRQLIYTDYRLPKSHSAKPALPSQDTEYSGVSHTDRLHRRRYLQKGGDQRDSGVFLNIADMRSSCM